LRLHNSENIPGNTKGMANPEIPAVITNNHGRVRCHVLLCRL
jgi:hypothetical protein